MPECQDCHKDKPGEVLIGGFCRSCRAHLTWATKMWVKPGAWARYARPLVFGSEDSFGQIDEVYTHPASGAMMLRFNILLGRDKGRELLISLDDFCKFWEPCDPPPEPPSVWERLVGDDVV
jgi:hypothetical protein